MFTFTLNTDKSGTDPKTFIDLVEYVRKSCPHLEFVGLMTIGAYDYDTSQGPNPDFVKLLQCRDDVSQKLGISIADIEVSMGMSADFEQAVSCHLGKILLFITLLTTSWMLWYTRWKWAAQLYV